MNFGKNNFKGCYPNYEFNLKVDKNEIDTFLESSSISYHYWVAIDSTDGYLPIGLGFFLNMDLYQETKSKE